MTTRWRYVCRPRGVGLRLVLKDGSRMLGILANVEDATPKEIKRWLQGAYDQEIARARAAGEDIG
jgi:hypothetical protein